MDEEIEDIIEELNTEQSEILDGYSWKYYLIRFIIVNIYFLHINTINVYTTLLFLLKSYKEKKKYIML